jgi:hypothetical protein
MAVQHSDPLAVSAPATPAHAGLQRDTFGALIAAIEDEFERAEALAIALADRLEPAAFADPLAYQPTTDYLARVLRDLLATRQAVAELRRAVTH